MNDFTKEELEILTNIIDKMYFGQFYADARVPKIYSKIQSMIESYCNHEKMEFDGDTFGYSCKQCEKQFTGQVVDADRHYNIICGKE